MINRLDYVKYVIIAQLWNPYRINSEHNIFILLHFALLHVRNNITEFIR